MGITAIKRIESRVKGHAVRFVNAENPDTTGGAKGAVLVQPFAGADVNVWIPWCTSAGDFPKHHLRVGIDDTTRVWDLWQAHRADGDFVRQSTDGVWHDPGGQPGGAAFVDGDRKLVVNPDLLVLEALGGASNASFGVYTASLGKGPNSTVDPTLYVGTSSFKGSIDYVRNVTRDASGRMTVPLYVVRFEEITGKVVGEVAIEPTVAVPNFNRLRVEGKWLVRATNVLASQLPSFVAIEIGWRTV